MKKSKKYIIILPILIAIIAFAIIYLSYSRVDRKTSLSVSEKRWVEKNKDNSFDIEIVNDYPLYAYNGDGVLFEFLSDFQEDVGIELGQNPYLKSKKPTGKGYKIRIVNNNTKLKKNDITIFNDYYVMISKRSMRINHIDDLKNLTIGIFSSDSEDISYYLKSATNISYNQYNTERELFNALRNNQVNMVIVPNIMYLNYTITGEYQINYVMTEYYKKLILTLSDNNDKLNTILRKYYTKWINNNYVNEYNKEYLNYYLKTNNIDAQTKSKLLGKNYVYGYVENEPYEVKVNGTLAGIAGEYINRTERLAKINFTYKKYNTKKELKEAIDRGKVDIYFDYYNYNNNKYTATKSTFIEDYVVLGKEKDKHIVTTLESLKDQDICMLQEDSLYNYFANNTRTNIDTYSNLNDLIKKSKDKVLVVDNEVYSYYQNTKFKKYKLLYKDTMMNDYKFMIKSTNKDFYNLFNYIINTNSYYNYRNTGIDNLHQSILANTSMQKAYMIVLIIIFIPLIVLGIVYLFLNRKRKKKKIKIDDKRKFTDMLTSLKNRNYLNAKMPEWEESNVFPQSIVIVDLNNVKYVNDNYGHEKGDELIVKAASILVNTQLENSEIIRTDGNEFLIYLVGYSEKQIATYTKKLSKEMKTLPHEFGAAIGYSMIDDSIKSLDDAINEATLEMITNKEEYK
ncbi:MAG: GGDEF domain-containing protein [Bacilli bacterium]|nr:GGDEF domain-containing protein [Bacilli bacterium]